MAAHPSCTWNRCRIVFRGEGRRRRRRRRIVYRKGIYRGFEVCPRNVDVVELMEQEERISTDGRAIEFRSCLARKGKISLTCPPRRKFIFVLFSSPFRFFSFSERERERDVRILSTSLFTKETIRANNFYPTRAVRK